MVTGVNLVQVDRKVDVVPHVVVNLHMLVESLWKRGAPSINIKTYITLNMLTFRCMYIYTMIEHLPRLYVQIHGWEDHI